MNTRNKVARPPKPATSSNQPRHCEDEDSPTPLSLSVRIVKLLFVIIPFIGLIASVVFFWGWGLSWVELVLLFAMYLVTGFGITIGYHRLFTHRSFQTSKVVQCIFAIMGSMAAQSPLLSWVAMHRRHHQHSDSRDDPHSPHHHGDGVLGVVRGFWHAHLGWVFKPTPPNIARYVRDLRQSKTLRVVSSLFPLWVAIGLLVPAFVGLLLIGGWLGALLGLIWGGLVRIFFVHHVTWSVNSVCHIWGKQPYPHLDQSKNNFVFGVLALGEGWHNNHHAFPTSARHGFRWWQFDASFWVIQLLAVCRLVWNVKKPMKQAFASG